ncbi:MAG: hypothetical protein ACLQOO_02945 [Terriglobia bacterium]
MISRDLCGPYAEGGREGEDFHDANQRPVSDEHLSVAVEREIQQLQVRPRPELAGNADSKKSGRRTRIEARRQRCRHARCERYLDVVELGRQGYTQLAIAEKVGVARFVSQVDLDLKEAVGGRLVGRAALARLRR